MAGHPTVPTPRAVETTVCSVCGGDWAEHRRAARDRVAPWYDSMIDPDEVVDHAAREQALDDAEIAVIDCLTVERDAHRGPPGPVGAMGARGDRGIQGERGPRGHLGSSGGGWGAGGALP